MASHHDDSKLSVSGNMNDASAISGSSWRSGAHNSQVLDGNCSLLDDRYTLLSMATSPELPADIIRPIPQVPSVGGIGLTIASLEPLPSSPKKGPQRVLTPYGRKLQQEAQATRFLIQERTAPPSTLPDIKARPLFADHKLMSVGSAPPLPLNFSVHQPSHALESLRATLAHNSAAAIAVSVPPPAQLWEGAEVVVPAGEEDSGSINSSLTGSIRSCSPPDVPMFGFRPMHFHAQMYPTSSLTAPTATATAKMRYAAPPPTAPRPSPSTSSRRTTIHSSSRVPAVITSTTTSTAGSASKRPPPTQQSPISTSSPQYRVQTLFGKAVVSRVVVKSPPSAVRISVAAAAPTTPVPSSVQQQEISNAAVTPLRMRDFNAHTPPPPPAVSEDGGSENNVKMATSIPVATPSLGSFPASTYRSPPSTRRFQATTTSASLKASAATATAPRASPVSVDAEAPRPETAGERFQGATASRLLSPSASSTTSATYLVEEGRAQCFPPAAATEAPFSLRGPLSFHPHTARTQTLGSSSNHQIASGRQYNNNNYTNNTTLLSPAARVEKTVRYRPQGNADPVSRWAEYHHRPSNTASAATAPPLDSIGTPEAAPRRVAAANSQKQQQQSTSSSVLESCAADLVALLESHNVTLAQCTPNHPLWPSVRKFLSAQGMNGVEAFTKAAMAKGIGGVGRRSGAALRRANAAMSSGARY